MNIVETMIGVCLGSFFGSIIFALIFRLMARRFIRHLAQLWRQYAPPQNLPMKGKKGEGGKRRSEI